VITLADFLTFWRTNLELPNFRVRTIKYIKDYFTSTSFNIVTIHECVYEHVLPPLKESRETVLPFSLSPELSQSVFGLPLNAAKYM
jgi:hypothetical protein